MGFRSRRPRPWRGAWLGSSDTAGGGWPGAVGCAPQYDRVDSSYRMVLAWPTLMLRCKTILLLCVGLAGCRIDDLYIYPDGQGPEMPEPEEMNMDRPALGNESQIL